MGKCEVVFKEIRFVIEDELTHAFVLCEALGDCPLGVQGWHHKAFGKSKSAIDILTAWGEGDDPVLWSQEAPHA